MPEQAVLYAELQVALDGEPAAPVRTLRHVSGGKSGGQSGLLVLGGQDAEQPDVLSMLPLQSPKEEVRRPQSCPALRPCTSCPLRSAQYSVLPITSRLVHLSHFCRRMNISFMHAKQASTTFWNDVLYSQELGLILVLQIIIA